MTRGARGIVTTLVCGLMVASVTACGAADSLRGSHPAPTSKPTAPPLTVEQADLILARTFAAARQGETGTGAVAQAALTTAYTGAALRAVSARLLLAGIPPAVADSPLLAPQQPRLLALSRGFGFPRFIVAETGSAKGGLPVLHLLTSPDAATPYRISESAELVPPVTVKPFDPPGRGSPTAGDGAGLAVTPAALLTSYAAWMAFPARSAPSLPFAADSFFVQVRANAAGVARAIAVQAGFSQVHKVVANSGYAVRQASGDALVFGVIERTDTFRVKPGQSVNTVANKAFVQLTGKKKITRSASVTTLEFVIFAVPRSTGQARLVAAREQIVAGSGS